VVDGYTEMFPADRDCRRAGVIMHPTSLPGNYGIGDMGTEAYAFVVGVAALHHSTGVPRLAMGVSPDWSRAAYRLSSI
jgi:4-alpha-glucanotransferase